MTKVKKLFNTCDTLVSFPFDLGLTLIVSRVAWRYGKPTHSFCSVKGWLYDFHTWAFNVIA